MAGDTLRARLLGSFELIVNGRLVDRSAFERPSGLRLLKLLLATPGHQIGREQAAELLWPEADPDRSAANLRKAIHFARRAIDGSSADADRIIASDADSLRFRPEVTIDADADHLAAALATVERANGAAEATVGDALNVLRDLGGHELLPEDPYEEWLIQIRERLRDRTLRALVRGAAIARSGGDGALAFSLIEGALALEPADEAAHRLAIELHLDADHLHAARRQLQAARRALNDAFAVEPSPELAKLIEDAAQRRALASPAAPDEQPIVGRRRELELGESALDRVSSGRPSSLMLRGPAGIGKSRIFRELITTTRAAGWRVLQARGAEATSNVAFAAIGLALIGALTDANVDDLVEPARSALLTVVPQAGASPAFTFASVGAIAQALVNALVALVGGTPTVLAIDDVQWLDQGSIGLLELVVAKVVNTPLFVLATAREERGFALGPAGRLREAFRRSGGEDVAVGPLLPREVEVLVEREADGIRVDHPVISAIAELSAGTPLFALELYRSGREEGTIELRDQAWRLARGAKSLRVPEGVARLVETRVGRLDDGARRVLATAAELGTDAGFDELLGAGFTSDEVLDALDAAINGGLLTDSSGRYVFSHPLFRAAFRDTLPVRQRGEIHRRAAMALAGELAALDVAGIRRAGVAGRDVLAVARHAADAVELGQVDTLPLAVAFGLAAGEMQARLFDFAGAAETLKRALQLATRLPEAQRPRFPIADGFVELGQALRRIGDDPAAEAAFGSAIAAAGHDVERARAYSAASWLPYEHGRFDRAIALLDEGLAQVTDQYAVAILQSARGWVVGRMGGWAEVVPLLTGALKGLEAGGPSAELMRALDRLGVAVRDSGDPAASIPILERARAMSVELNRSGETATYEMHLGGALRELGQYDEALRALSRSRELCELTGERYIAAVTEWITAEVEQSRGDYAAAIAHRRRELAIFAELGGNARHEALAHAHIAHLARQMGDADLERLEADSAMATASLAGQPSLPQEVESRLASDDWFA